MSKSFNGDPAPVLERVVRNVDVSDVNLARIFLKMSVGDYQSVRKHLSSQEPVEVIRTAEVPVSLKTMVQNHCEENGILWVPIPNRFMEAKQVYRCGKLQVYFDRNVIFVSQGGGSFTPMSRHDLFENAV